MKQTGLIIISDGFEEIEAITPLDILRRGEIEVIIAGYKGNSVTGAHGLIIKTDCILSNVLSEAYDCLIFPGGPGCYNLRDDKPLRDFIRKHYVTSRLICAICAAPLILHDAGILSGKKYTAHPCTYDELAEAISSEPVVTDDNLITGSGPGAATKFGFEIIKKLTDERFMQQLVKSMLFNEKF